MELRLRASERYSCCSFFSSFLIFFIQDHASCPRSCSIVCLLDALVCCCVTTVLLSLLATPVHTHDAAPNGFVTAELQIATLTIFQFGSSVQNILCKHLWHFLIAYLLRFPC